MLHLAIGLPITFCHLYPGVQCAGSANMNMLIYDLCMHNILFGKRNQNASIWCVLWGYGSKFWLWLHSQRMVCKFALISKFKQRNYNTENFWLKEQTQSNWKISILPGSPSFYLKIWLSEVKCHIPFYYKKLALFPGPAQLSVTISKWRKAGRSLGMRLIKSS